MKAAVAVIPANNSEPIKLKACALSGEQELPCGSIVTVRDGRIIAKVSPFPVQW